MENFEFAITQRYVFFIDVLFILSFFRWFCFQVNKKHLETAVRRSFEKWLFENFLIIKEREFEVSI